ncbi:gas vesicle protein GvpG [Streptomyces bambusae]|uniref:gas vesicle protein GvpG n=1 Tax=Streptomyces bambusae TaxID=1550616 RepID=UPI001CFE14A2|nr:gas vesicle protein GvpG [Streptomyces bambusae]MCB5164268.1 gas vesicle protein GvpG [Streptomyces bambusae]
MGLVTALLTAPLLPVRAVLWAAQRVAERAEAEYYDPAPVLAGLVRLEQQLAAGEIDEDAFDRQEDALLDRLAEIEEFRRARASGGDTT